MITYTAQDTRAARRYLTALSIAKPTTDREMVELAVAHGFMPTAPDTAPKRAKPPVQLPWRDDDTAPDTAAVPPLPPIEENTVPTPATTDATAAALAQLINTLTPAAAAPQFDEAALKAAIEKYSCTTLVIDKPATAAPAVTIKSAHRSLASVVKIVNLGRHVFLSGPAGSGKTTLASQCAESLGLNFYSTGAVLQKYELTGFMDANNNYHETEFYKAFTRGGVFLFDEMDASNPSALVAFNQALANHTYSFPNGDQKRHKDFVVIAAANTDGTGATRAYSARNALDGATLDRYTRVNVQYDKKVETRMAQTAYARAGGTDTAALELIVIQQFRGYRAAAEKAGLSTVIISPRTLEKGAELLALGFNERDIKAMALPAMSKDQLKQIGA